MDERGREAEAPGDIPARGWRDVAVRVKRELARDHVSIIAAGVAFYGFLAIFPAVAAIISIYGLVADPAGIQRQLLQLTGILPHDVREMLGRELTQIAGSSGKALSLGLVTGIALALWSAHQGVTALFQALDIAYGEEEKRGFFKFNGLALLFTLGAILFVVVAMALVIALPPALGFIGLSSFAEKAIELLRWPVLAAAVLLGVGLLYRHGPSRTPARWRWINLGSVVATALWLLASLGFSWYVAHFGSYNKTYGSVAAIVILLVWFYMSAYVVLLGAEINAEAEHQTRKDSTVGEPAPLGDRGAQMADTVGETPR
jgi:membrane protein